MMTNKEKIERALELKSMIELVLLLEGDNTKIPGELKNNTMLKQQVQRLAVILGNELAQ